MVAGYNRKNNVDPDQTAPEEQSDQGLHCLFIQPTFYEIFPKRFRTSIEFNTVRFKETDTSSNFSVNF